MRGRVQSGRGRSGRKVWTWATRRFAYEVTVTRYKTAPASVQSGKDF